MSRYRPETRIAWMIIRLILLLCLASSVCADQVMLLFDAVPEHGLMVRHVDLTSAAKRCESGTVSPTDITASDQEGNTMPFQFIPDADFDSKQGITGFVITRLSPDKKGELKLEFGSKAQQPVRSQPIETAYYTVFHDAKRGGLPAKIVFRKTGKVFDNFRWQDRLHHKELGGFVLQNDRTAAVEYLSTGPLCTVVRVKAKYVSSDGSPPASDPEATYTWIYLNDLPLVFVTAEVRQAKEFAWNELHFLELNFPGEDFKSWAGGEPLSEGGFEATGKSHNAGKWGALVEGRDAIAMFDCGRLIFHDGRGGYGTYLHAHGDQAWGGWSKERTRSSAWLWVGSADSPVKEIRVSIDKTPAMANVLVTTTDVHNVIKTTSSQHIDNWRNAMARQLEAGGRLEEAVDVAQGRLLSNWTRVQAGDLNLVLEKAEQGLRVLSLFDEGAGQELLVSDSPALFSLEMRHSGKKEHVALTADSGWRQVEVSQPDSSGRRVLTFREPLDDRLDGIGVEVRIRSNRKDNALMWDLQVSNDNEKWGLWRVVFPQVSVRYLGEGSSIFLPHTAGIELSDMWNTADRRGGTYPSGWTCMQYMASYDAEGKTGFYLGMHDPFGSTKDILAQGLPDRHAVAFRFEHPAGDMGQPGVDFALPGQAKWQLLRGDWFDAAQIYRDWVSREAKWWPSLGPEGRSDTPQWMKELPAWALTGGPPSDCVPSVKAFAEELGVPVGFHWYNWHQIPFDNDYPHYFPVKDGFGDGVAELKKAGVYVMPYINGRLWDTHDKEAEDWQFTRVALPAATKDDAGNPYTESYGSKETDGNSVTLAAMCPSTPLWQNRVHDIVLRLLNEYSLNAVYIDQVAAAQPTLCFDKSHGHPLGGGHWWTEGYWKMLDAIRAAKPVECMLTTECNAEPYIKWFDGYLTWHWQEQNMVPAFPAVYGGAIQMFGRAYRGGDSQDLANRMKAGQQLVFGEQIGWFGPEIIKRSECGQFVRDCIQLRRRLKEYFFAGRMVRPPELIGEIPKVTADWQWRGTWPITTDAVMTGAWRDGSSKKVVLLFANVSDKPFDGVARVYSDECGVADESYRVEPFSVEESRDRLTIKADGRADVVIGARTVAAWELTPASDLRSDFIDPPVVYWPRPLWFWNNTQVSVETIEEQMRQSKEASKYGGFGILPFGKSFGPEYLSEDYFRIYGMVLSLARELGMRMSLYDEYGFPSGSAGAPNSSDLSLFAQWYPQLTLKRLDKHEQTITGPLQYAADLPKGEIMSVVAMNIATKERMDLTKQTRGGQIRWDAPEGAWKVMSFVCVPDGYPCCDYLDPSAVEKFVEITHQAYYDRFKEHFGTTIDSTFYDEPTLYRGEGRTWTPRFNEKFEDKYGFDPRPYYPALWYDIGPKTEAARNYLFGFRAELYSLGFPKIVQDWSESHGIQATGHQDQEEVVNPVSVSGDLMKCFEHQAIPGIDKIGGNRPAERVYKIISSAAYNWDKALVMSETYGAMGNLIWNEMYSVALEQYTKGINMLIPHAVWYDDTNVVFKPELSYRSGLYGKGLSEFNIFIARMNVLLQNDARHVCDIAVLYPIATLQAGHHLDGPLGYYAGGVEVNEADYMDVGELLIKGAGRDYTFIHPEVLDEKCEIEGDELVLQNRIHAERFKVLILPGHETIRWSNLAKIQRFLHAGGKVIATGALPSKSAEFGHDADIRNAIKDMFAIDTNMAAGPFHLRKNECGGMAIRLRKLGAESLRRALDSALKTYDIEFENGDILRYIHKVGSRNIYLFANITQRNISTCVNLREQIRPEMWNPHTGQIKQIECKHQTKGGADITSIAISLDPGRSVFIVHQEE